MHVCSQFLSSFEFSDNHIYLHSDPELAAHGHHGIIVPSLMGGYLSRMALMTENSYLSA